MTALDALRERPLLEVAAMLGLHAGPKRSLGPCPSCRAERRSAGDRRFPIGVTPNSRGWRCFRCDVRGDAITLAAWSFLGRCPPAGDPAWRDLIARLGDPVAMPPPSGPVVPKVPPPRPPPGTDEVRRAWQSCGLAGGDPEVRAWLRRRGLDVGLVEDRDLCRALPPGFSARWAWGPNLTPWAAGWRAIVPTWGPEGDLAGLRGRWVSDSAPPAGVKAATPIGGAPGVMSCGLGRQILGSAMPPLWWPEGRPLRVVIVEGEPAWLRACTEWGDADEAAPAVLGIASGAWKDEIAARIPDGAQITIATDHDKAGDRYAAAIVASLGGRCVLRRWCGVARG